MITPDKETHHKMQKAYLKSKRNPLPIVTIDVSKWVKETSEQNSRRTKR